MKISELSPTVGLSATAIFPVVQNGTTTYATVSQVLSAVGTVSPQMVFSSSTSPEGVQAAPVGSICNEISAGTYIKQWVKTVGSGATGWQ